MAYITPIADVRATFDSLIAVIEEYRDYDWVVRVPMKENIGEDVQKKIEYVYRLAIKEGYTKTEAKLLLGLIDFESAGSWSETIRGDNGNSVGIGQWHKPSGRKAPKDFEGQARQIVEEMKWKFNNYPALLAVTSHNCPACAYNGWIKWDYVNRVLESSKQFK